MNKKLMDIPSDEISESLEKGRLMIAVIGLGRIGLPTAVSFAEAGANVIGIDINADVVSAINNGRSKFTDEPELNERLKKVVVNGKLIASTKIEEIAEADAIVVAVPTPVDERKTPDYSHIKSACENISKQFKRNSLIMIESTVGPGTVEGIIVPLLEAGSRMKAGMDFGVASCPERADPGKIMRDMKNIPRIIGGVDDHSTDIAAALYEKALGIKAVKVSNPKTANASKLMENIFRDVNIALANEFALLFEKLGIDSIEVINACATKYNFVPHFPGAGVGGPCLPSNSYYLISEGVKVGNIPYLVRFAREINDRMPDHVVTLVAEALNEVNKTVKGSKISILGISYKPNIKDIQLTPIEKICGEIQKMGASCALFDPYCSGEIAFGCMVENDLQSVVKGADCILIGTAHDELKNLNLEMLARLSNNPTAIVDARHVVDPKKARENGFVYRGVGRI